MRYIGILCELGVVDKNDLLFEKDCEITCPDRIPIILNFDFNNAKSVVGRATVRKDDESVKVDCIFDNSIPDEYLSDDGRIYVGGYYGGVISEVDPHGILHITHAKLTGVGIIPKRDSSNVNCYVTKYKDE